MSGAKTSSGYYGLSGGPLTPKPKEKKPVGKPVVYTFTRPNSSKKPVRQTVPLSWVTSEKTLKELLRNVVPALAFQASDVSKLEVIPEDEGALATSLDLNSPIGEVLKDGSSYAVKMKKENTLAEKEGAPSVRTHIIYQNIAQRVRVEGVEDISVFQGKVKVPGGEVVEASVLPLAGGGCEVVYKPSAPGVHVLEVMMNGTPISDKTPFNVEEPDPVPYAWHELSDDERQSVLSWIHRRLNCTRGLQHVLAVHSAATTCPVCPTTPAEAESWIDTDASLRLVGVVAQGGLQGSPSEKWLAFKHDLLEGVPSARCMVVIRQEKDVNEMKKDTWKALQHNYTRAGALESQRVPNATGGGAEGEDESMGETALMQMACSIGKAAAASAAEGNAHYELSLAAFEEQWVGAHHVEKVRGVQLEGFATARSQTALAAVAGAAGAAAGLSADYVDALNAVVWYASADQGALHCIRKAVSRYVSSSALQLHEDNRGLAHLERRLAFVTQQKAWLSAVEEVCAAVVPNGLTGLLADGAMTAATLPPPPMATAGHDWRAGRHRVASQPPIEVYPNFLTDAEIEYLVRLGLCHAAPQLVLPENATKKDADEASARAQMPTALSANDPLLQELEKRFAEATGVPVHPDEATLVVRFAGEASKASADPVPHVEIGLPNKSRCYKCATVVVYMNDIKEGLGGDLRFPLADSDPNSPLARTAQRVLWCNTEIDMSDEKQPKDYGRVHEMSQAKAYGVHIPVKKGKAVVYWNMEADQTVDPLTWHGEARVQPGGGGSIILEKAKELPKMRRKMMGQYAERGWKPGGPGEGRGTAKERTVDEIWEETKKQVPIEKPVPVS